MKKILIHVLFILSSGILPVIAYADSIGYVSDDLSTWLRSGPGEQYRLSGKIKSGDTVTILQTDSENNYAQVKDQEGRTAWIPLSELSNKPSVRVLVPQLQQQVKQLTEQLANINETWDHRTAEMQHKVSGSDQVINQLKNENTALKDELVVARKKVNAANVQLDDKQRAIIMQWFVYGGGVLCVGLILGLVLPRLIPRRKSHNRWMN